MNDENPFMLGSLQSSDYQPRLSITPSLSDTMRRSPESNPQSLRKSPEFSPSPIRQSIGNALEGKDTRGSFMNSKRTLSISGRVNSLAPVQRKRAESAVAVTSSLKKVNTSIVDDLQAKGTLEFMI
jgi:hypothetical protein